jgi:zinc protease
MVNLLGPALVRPEPLSCYRGPMLNALSLLLLAAAPASPPLVVPFERYTLSNGLTVLLHEDHRVPTVTVNLWYSVGAADERPGRSGFAHLFEHLMFMGTNEVPNGSFDTVMEQAGGTNNATTSPDRTNYYETGPSSLLETFLYLEGDRLAHLADAMTRAKLDLQRDVVKNERRQSYETRPYGRQWLIIFDRLFPEGHPYHHPVIGSHADLTAASVEDVKAFFRTWYVPGNASLVIAGDFAPAQAKAWVDQYLGVVPRAEPPPRPVPAPVALKKAVRVVQPEAVQNERVVLAWLAPAAWTRGDAEVELLAAALGQGKTSRLVRPLVLEQQLASEVQVVHRSLRGQSILSIVATAQGGHTAAELEKALDVELERLMAEPLSAAETDRARALVTKDLLTDLESTFRKADLLNELQVTFGDPGMLQRVLSRYDALTPSDLTEVAGRVLGKPRLTLSFVPSTPREKSR